MNQQEKIIKLATEVMGWEAVRIGYWGYGNMERGRASARQYELRDWLEDVELTDIGDYFLDVPSNFWIEQSDWNPYGNWNHAGMLWDKLNERGNIRIDQMVDGGQCSCNLILWSGDGEYGAYAPSFPSAISDTALATTEATK